MPEVVSVKVVGDVAALATSMDTATGKVGGLAKTSRSVLSPAMLGVAGVAVGAALAITDFTLAAAEDRDEQEKLATALEASGAATDGWEAKVADATTSAQALAFADSDVRAGLIPLAQATGDVDEALGLMSVAQDVARLAGVDLETASKAIAKAHEGQTGALTRLVPALAGAEEGTDLVAEAQRLAAGQADTFAQSTEGQLAASGVAFDELTETIGAAFLPVLDEIVPLLVPIITKLGQLLADILPPLVDALKPVVEALGIFLDTAGDLLRKILPHIMPWLKRFADSFKTMAGFIDDVVGFVDDLIGKIGDLLKPLQDALGGLQGLLDFDMPSFDLPDLWSAPEPAPAARGRARGGITIHTGADPVAVVRHVRAYVAANGGLR